MPTAAASAGPPLPPATARRPNAGLPPPAAADDVPVLRPGLLSRESQAALKAQYEGSQPYPHCVIHDICDPQLLRKVGRGAAGQGQLVAGGEQAAGMCAHARPLPLHTTTTTTTACGNRLPSRPPALPPAARQVRDEIIENVEATYKETDLFKMFQTGDVSGAGLVQGWSRGRRIERRAGPAGERRTGDAPAWASALSPALRMSPHPACPQLANLDKLPREQAAKLPSVFRLRQAIYSPEFRAFISQVTGGWVGWVRGGLGGRHGGRCRQGWQPGWQGHAPRASHAFPVTAAAAAAAPWRRLRRAVG